MDGDSDAELMEELKKDPRYGKWISMKNRFDAHMASSNIWGNGRVSWISVHAQQPPHNKLLKRSTLAHYLKNLISWAGLIQSF